MAVIVAWIHYIAIMLMMASLLGEHLALKAKLTAAESRRLQRLDVIYGAAAMIVLVTGIGRMYLEKGVTYYLQSGAFHALVGIFVVVAVLSIYPTVTFLHWRADTGAGHGRELAAGPYRNLQMIMRLEMALVLLAPLFATWMAHGSFY